MEITEVQFQGLSTHLRRNRDLPPQAVYWVVSLLVDDPASIRASVRSYHPGPPTVWRVAVLTETAIAVAVVQFSSPEHTLEMEEPHRTGGTPREGFEVVEARAYPLAAIKGMAVDIGASNRAEFFPRVSLVAEGADTPLGLPLAGPNANTEDQERSKAFVKALREAVGWLT